MGIRGPVPLRSDERLGHPHGKADEVTPDKVVLSGAVEVPPVHEGWHGLAKSFYRSLIASGQSRYYEPSDWALAQLACHLLSDELRNEDGVNPRVMALFTDYSKRLLVSEADRRRHNMEVERVVAQSPTASTAGVSRLDDRREALKKGKR